MPIVKTKTTEIPAKRYSGIISNVRVKDEKNKRGDPVQYLELTVQTKDRSEGWDGAFRIGYPFHLTNNSGLGRLLNRLEIEVKDGEEWDEQDLNGVEVVFDTIKEGYFTNPVVDSVELA